MGIEWRLSGAMLLTRSPARCTWQHTLRFRRFALLLAVFCSSSLCRVTFCSCRCA